MERIFGNGSDSTRGWEPQPRERGTFSILSTCLITLGLCVWTAVHLNLPEHRGFWRQIRRKLGWMMLGFLAPELVRTPLFLLSRGQLANQQLRSHSPPISNLWKREGSPSA